MPFGDQEAEELPQRRKPPRLRARGEPAPGSSGEIGADVVGARARASRACLVAKILEVAAIGGERIGARAALGREHFQKRLEERRVAGRPARGATLAAQGCSRSVGIRTLISRCFGSTMTTSAIMPP